MARTYLENLMMINEQGKSEIARARTAAHSMMADPRFAEWIEINLWNLERCQTRNQRRAWLSVFSAACMEVGSYPRHPVTHVIITDIQHAIIQ